MHGEEFMMRDSLCFLYICFFGLIDVYTTRDKYNEFFIPIPSPFTFTLMRTIQPHQIDCRFRIPPLKDLPDRRSFPPLHNPRSRCTLISVFRACFLSHLPPRTSKFPSKPHPRLTLQIAPTSQPNLTKRTKPLQPFPPPSRSQLSLTSYP